VIVLLLSVVEGNSLVIVSCWRREGDASVLNVVHGEGQPLTLGIVVSGNLREKFRDDSPA
jgi:hypothetical protein